jgi:SpoVK/Ycf46/Vps4 family AAA+-type ATPase
VVLATNRPHVIDAALLRDGRCDRKIKIERPTEDVALAILRHSLAKAPFARGVTLEEIAAAALERLFSAERPLMRIHHSKGDGYITLGSIINGAMVVGLVERMKGYAFERDLAAAGVPTGLSLADVHSAIDALWAENLDLPHIDAVIELVAPIGATVEHVERGGKAFLPRLVIKGSGGGSGSENALRRAS